MGPIPGNVVVGRSARWSRREWRSRRGRFGRDSQIRRKSRRERRKLSAADIVRYSRWRFVSRPKTKKMLFLIILLSVFCFCIKEHYAPTKSLKTLIFYSSAIVQYTNSLKIFFGNILVNRSYSLLVVSWVKRLKSPLDAYTHERGEEGVSINRRADWSN